MQNQGPGISSSPLRTPASGVDSSPRKARGILDRKTMHEKCKMQWQWEGKQERKLQGANGL